MAAVCLVLVACGDDEETGDEVGTGDRTSTTNETTTTAPTTADETTTTAPTSTEETTSTAATAADPSLEGASREAKSGSGTDAARAQITDVRLGDRRASDRFVVEFAGGELPDFEVAYDDGPIIEAGSGRPVEVAGDTSLVVRMDGASGYDLAAENPTYGGAERLAGPGQAINEAVLSGDFEAVTSWVLGLDERRAFTVTTLASPSRLVVDVAS